MKIEKNNINSVQCLDIIYIDDYDLLKYLHQYSYLKDRYYAILRLIKLQIINVSEEKEKELLFLYSVNNLKSQIFINELTKRYIPKKYYNSMVFFPDLNNSCILIYNEGVGNIYVKT